MKSNKLSQTQEKYIKMDGLKDKECQKDFLKELLTKRETGNGSFVVLSMEAGVGKSRGTDEVIGEEIHSGSKHTYLIVKMFQGDVQACEDAINKACDRENVALGIIEKNWSELKNTPELLENYQVIIITHARYADLCNDESFRPYFEKGRHTLIIDEEIQTPICTFSMSTYIEAMNAVKSYPGLAAELAKLCIPLMEELDSNWKENNRILTVKSGIDSEQLSVAEKLSASVKGYCKNKAAELIHVLKGLEVFGGFYSNHQINTLNPHIKRWKLQNNIILDANGVINKLYGYAPDVEKIFVMPKVLDYSKTTIHPIVYKSSKSSIQSDSRYIPTVTERALNAMVEGDKLLFVTHKENVESVKKHLNALGINDVAVGDEYNEQAVAITYFGNFLGKNHWRNFNKVWIIATNNWNMDAYLLNWSFYTQNRISTDNLGIHVKDNAFRFVDSEYESIRHSRIVCSIYQACKRINRCDDPKEADIYIVNGDIQVIQDVAKQFKNAKVAKEDTLQELIKKKEKRSIRKNPTYASKLIDALGNRGMGTYLKNELCSEIGCPPNNFYKVLNHTSIVELESKGIVYIEQHNIKVILPLNYYCCA